jgi:hypothetical protein
LLVTVIVVVLVMFGAAVSVGAASSESDVGPKDQGAVFTEAVGVPAPVGVTPVVYVATGENFPDALGAASASAVQGGPVLLVQPNAIPAATAVELSRLSPNVIYVAGGPAVVSDAVFDALKAYTPNVHRVAGQNRYETAVEVSKSAFPAAHQFMVYDTNSATTAIGNTCTSYDGLAVPITVPGPGTIVVDANVNLHIKHTAGATNEFLLYIGTSPTDCTPELGNGGDSTFVIMDAEPTGDYYPWLTMKKVLHVDSAGTHTFYFNGKDSFGPDTGELYYAYVDATFIPDPGT